MNLSFLSVSKETFEVRVQRRQDEENEDYAALPDSSMTSSCFSSQLSSVWFTFIFTRDINMQSDRQTENKKSTKKEFHIGNNNYSFSVFLMWRVTSISNVLISLCAQTNRFHLEWEITAQFRFIMDESACLNGHR